MMEREKEIRERPINVYADHGYPPHIICETEHRDLLTEIDRLRADNDKLRPLIKAMESVLGDIYDSDLIADTPYALTVRSLLAKLEE